MKVWKAPSWGVVFLSSAAWNMAVERCLWGAGVCLALFGVYYFSKKVNKIPS